MSQTNYQPWLHRFAVFTALATLALLGVGGLVTSHGVGMAVHDWPTSYGYNMFALPFSIWFTGGIFQEHTHRQWASCVGVLVVLLTRWLGGEKSRKPLLIVGAVELAAGLAMFRIGADWRGAGGFLSGIGGVVLLVGAIWARNSPAAKPLPRLGWWAFGLVQLQGLLGGLRVILDAQVIAGMKLGTAFGIFHACLGQAFFVLLCAIALLTGKWWVTNESRRPPGGKAILPFGALGASGRWLLVLTTLLVFLQLMIGATMRHQHAGLAIPDFPLTYGRLWPAMDADSVAGYNARRIETTAANPITATQVGLQMAHRLLALMILVCVSTVAWRTRRTHQGIGVRLRRLASLWLGLILLQIVLGAWTIWSDKAADVATAHVLVGALSLVTGALGCIIAFRYSTGPLETTALAAASFDDARSDSFPGNPATVLNQP